MRLSLNMAKRLIFFACLSCVGYAIVAAISFFIQIKFGITTPSIRILTVIQDILLFITPALGTAMLITRLPATFLCIDRRPAAASILWGIVTLTASIPLMDAVITWNQSWTLPQSMASLEKIIRAAEDQANALTEMMLGGHSAGSLLMGILIVGILAAISEELFFRGSLQRLLTTGRVNHHIAVWASAIIFSAFHMQIFGFVPRMLLGALFGYALVWSRSLWVPITLHAFNNTLYVIARYTTADKQQTSITEFLDNHWTILTSALLTATALYFLWRTRTNPTPQIHD